MNASSTSDSTTNPPFKLPYKRVKPQPKELASPSSFCSSCSKQLELLEARIISLEVKVSEIEATLLEELEEDEPNVSQDLGDSDSGEIEATQPSLKKSKNTRDLLGFMTSKGNRFELMDESSSSGEETKRSRFE